MIMVNYYISRGDTLKSSKSRSISLENLKKMYGKNIQNVLTNSKKGRTPGVAALNGNYYIVHTRPFVRKLTSKKGDNYNFTIKFL